MLDVIFSPWLSIVIAFIASSLLALSARETQRARDRAEAWRVRAEAWRVENIVLSAEVGAWRRKDWDRRVAEQKAINPTFPDNPYYVPTLGSHVGGMNLPDFRRVSRDPSE